MKSFAVFVLVTIGLLQGCATAPSVCPKLPPPPSLAPQGPSFLDLTASFLSGKLPEQTNYALPSLGAKPGLKVSQSKP